MPATDAAAGAPGAGELPHEAGAMVRALAAEPRPAGGAAEARARVACARYLAEQGFAVRDEPFAYSAFPGRWATPVGGAASILLLGAAGHVGFRGGAGAALAILVAGGAAVAAAAAWIARHGVLRLPVLRARSVNLVAERSAARGAPPERWLVAHLDSKSQPVPIGARAAGVVGSGAAWVAALAVAVAQLLGAGVATWWPWVGAAGAVAGVPVLLSVVGARSPGALDNATGVAAVLATVAQLPRDVPVGVLLTSAEELGLAGARAWGERATPALAINFDGVDDAGALTAMYTGARPARLLAAVAQAAGAQGVACRERRLLPGILVDALALADRGWEVLTLSRGTLATLGRIHRPADRADRVAGTGVAEAARVAASAIVTLHQTREG